MLIAVIFYLLIAIALWKVFRKMGLAGWKGIIPVVNMFVLFRTLWNVRAFVVYLVCTLAGAALEGAGCMALVGAAAVLTLGISGAGTAASVGIVFCLAGLVLCIVALVTGIRLYHRLSVAFGHGAGFTIGLVLIPYIMLLVLAFGRSEYIQADSGADNNAYQSGGY